MRIVALLNCVPSGDVVPYDFLRKRHFWAIVFLIPLEYEKLLYMTRCFEVGSNEFGVENQVAQKLAEIILQRRTYLAEKGRCDYER